ncbi:MAG TPA: hypothetical protein VGV89_03605 [Thermoplasmata archaeon]|nr:hypothetical protein [Thermoplasmata archaeon]
MADASRAAQDVTGPGRERAADRGPTAWVRLRNYLARHPIVLLFLLTPGIPEYLSGSSSLALALLNPFAFLLFLGANAALYLPGALLVREARVRWKKGWATVMLLGAAYGIAEEGLALSTLFNSHAGPVGGLGYYGHWLGVSWVWAVGVLMFHVVFSISLPILLLDLALPQRRQRPLLSDRGLAWAFAILGTDIVLLFLFVDVAERFSASIPILVGSILVIALLVWLAHTVPAHLISPTGVRPFVSPRRFALYGVVLFPGSLLLEALAGAARFPPILTVAAVLAFFTALLYAARRGIGWADNQRRLIAFAAGALLPVAIFGFVAHWPLPVVLVEDVLLGLFLRHMWRRYPQGQTVPNSPVAPPTVTPAIPQQIWGAAPGRR